MLTIDEVNPGAQSKEARLDACLPEFEAGLVYLPEGADWSDAYIGELASFPLGSFDDRVDSTSMALNHMRGRSSYVLPKW